MIRAAFAPRRGRPLAHGSWLSALLDGRVTGSGAIFAKEDPFQSVINQTQQNAQQAAREAAQVALNQVAPGNVIIPQELIWIAVAVVVYLLFIRKSG